MCFFDSQSAIDLHFVSHQGARFQLKIFFTVQL